MNPHEELLKLDQRLGDARQAHRRIQGEHQSANADAAAKEEHSLEVEAKRAAGLATDSEVKTARKEADQARENASQDRARAVEVAAKTIGYLEAERASFIGENLVELEGRLEGEQVELRGKAETHASGVVTCVDQLHQLNNERADLRRAVGLDTRDLPRFDRLDELKRQLRQAEMGAMS